MKEILFTHRDFIFCPFHRGQPHILEEDRTTKAVAVFDKSWTDAEICNAVRNGLVARGDIELDELDMDDDGIVQRHGDVFTIIWTHSRGAKSVTTLKF